MKRRPKDSGRTPLQWLREEDANPEEVLRRLLHEASSTIPGLSSDPTLTDPLVRLLLSSVAKEYVRLYGRLDDVIDVAYRRLVDSLLSFPRAPQPSSTVLHLALSEEQVEIDRDLRVIGRKAIQEGNVQQDRAIHFAPLGSTRLPGVPSPALVLEDADGSVRLLSTGAERPGEPGAGAGSAGVAPRGSIRLYLGLDLPFEPAWEELPLFVLGSEAVVRRLIWSTWEAGAAEDPLRVVPGQKQDRLPWDGRGNPPFFRSRTDQRVPDSPYERNFAHLDADFIEAGRGLAPAAVEALVQDGHLPSAPGRCWLSILPEARLSASDLAPIRVLSNCVIAFNQNQEFASFNLGSESIQEIALEVGYEDLFRIDEVNDSANTLSYEDAETATGARAQERYHLELDPDGPVHLRLAAGSRAVRPRKIEVVYTTTHGRQADGLEAGSIDTVFDKRATPGVSDAVNVVPSAGGDHGARRPRHVAELRALLTTRGRAVTRKDFEDLTLAFDPARIASAEAGRGVTRRDDGVSSCVLVKVQPTADAFTGPLEREDFRVILHDYLQARAAAGQSVVVHLVEAAT